MTALTLELPLDPVPQQKPAEGVRFDWLSAFCREKFDAPEDWRWHSWERKEFDKPHEFMIVRGAVCYAKKAKGKYKGWDDWKRAEAGTERTYSITRKDLEAFQIEWQAKTGMCFECYGTGEAWAGWSAKEGTRYAPCRHCDATGKAKS